jgi:ABC-2 type transport system ATP-binding protein
MGRPAGRGRRNGDVSADASPAIEVIGLRKRYGAVQAVDGISFTVRRGEVFGMLGPNGAGKTTTVEIIEGLRPADSGRVTVLGLDVARQPRAVKERVGVQLQTPALLPRLTVRELVALFASFYRTARSPDEVIALVGLEESGDRLAGTLSGGQTQRLSLALALVNRPEIVFLDEPTTGLDPQARLSLWGLIERVRAEGTTVVLTTHYMEEAERLCDRVAIIDRGRIVALDAPRALIAAHFQETAITAHR